MWENLGAILMGSTNVVNVDLCRCGERPNDHLIVLQGFVVNSLCTSDTRFNTPFRLNAPLALCS